MPNALANVPFLRMLLPLVAGILIQYYYCNVSYWSIILLFFGQGIMLLSFFVKTKFQYRFRWLFGLGLYTSLFAIGTVCCSLQQKHATFNFSDEVIAYRGVVVDVPKIKEKAIACHLHLEDYDKEIIGYFQLGVRSKDLKLGDEIVFSGKIKPIRNFDSLAVFDYRKYMYHQGFSGMVYLTSSNWETTGTQVVSLRIKALEIRTRLIAFFSSLGLSTEEVSILSALTLGYKENVSDDIKQAFRSTGTAHLFAVSGLHVTIIYGAISFLFNLLSLPIYFRWLKSFLIICLLSFYALITGASPSVLRAVILISLFCISENFGCKGFSYNNLAIAAFFLLLFNSFFLFDIGFQLSFSAVLAILFLYPKLESLCSPENKLLKYGSQLFNLSLVAQLGTLPLSLYYFGSFPTYFFLTNLLVVPLVFIIIHTVGIVGISYLLSCLFSTWSFAILWIPIQALQILLRLLMHVLHFFESLPFALIDNVVFSFLHLLLFSSMFLFTTLFFVYKKARMLIVTLLTVWLFIVSLLFDLLLDIY